MGCRLCGLVFGEVGKMEGYKLMKWQDGNKGRRVVKVAWEGGRFLVLLFMGGGEHRVSPRFCLLISDIGKQGNKAHL